MDRNLTAFSEYVLEHYGSGVMSRGYVRVTAEIQKGSIYNSPEAIRIHGDTLLKIRHRIWKLCSEPRQSISGKATLQILGMPMICPKCGSHQFSISVSEKGQRPPDWPPSVLGSADCGGCDSNFLVKLPPELENALMLMAKGKQWKHGSEEDVYAVVKFLRSLFY